MTGTADGCNTILQPGLFSSNQQQPFVLPSGCDQFSSILGLAISTIQASLYPQLFEKNLLIRRSTRIHTDSVHRVHVPSGAVSARNSATSSRRRCPGFHHCHEPISSGDNEDPPERGRCR